MNNIAHVWKVAVASSISPKYLFNGEYEVSVAYQPLGSYNPVRSTVTSIYLHFDSWCLPGFNHKGTSNITQTSLFSLPFICFSSLFLSVGRFPSDCNMSSWFLQFIFICHFVVVMKNPVISSLFPKSVHISLIKLRSSWIHFEITSALSDQQVTS